MLLSVNGGLTVNSLGRNPFFFVCGNTDGFTGNMLSDYGTDAYTSTKATVGIYVTSVTATNPLGAKCSVVGSSPGQHVAITAQTSN